MFVYPVEEGEEEEEEKTASIRIVLRRVPNEDNDLYMCRERGEDGKIFQGETCFFSLHVVEQIDTQIEQFSFVFLSIASLSSLFEIHCSFVPREK